jgi:hypothetical protein
MVITEFKSLVAEVHLFILFICGLFTDTVSSSDYKDAFVPSICLYLEPRSCSTPIYFLFVVQ